MQTDGSCQRTIPQDWSVARGTRSCCKRRRRVLRGSSKRIFWQVFCSLQRKAIAEEDAEGEENCDYAEEDDEAWMRQLAEDIKSGAIRSKSGEGYFVLKGEYYGASEAGRKTTEYRDLTPRNLSLSIGIKTVKFQRGYGHPGKPPKQMRYEISSVRLMDASDRECDPYAIPPGFLATTIAINLGRRIG